MTINPPVMISNNLFSDIELIKEKDDKEARYITPGMFTYLYNRPLEKPLPEKKEERMIAIKDGLHGPCEKYKIAFRADDQNYYVGPYDYLYSSSQT